VVGEAGCSEPSRSMDQMLAEQMVADQIMGAGI
jgi:serine O-acetyltransferase